MFLDWLFHGFFNLKPPLDQKLDVKTSQRKRLNEDAKIMSFFLRKREVKRTKLVGVKHSFNDKQPFYGKQSILVMYVYCIKLHCYDMNIDDENPTTRNYEYLIDI